MSFRQVLPRGLEGLASHNMNSFVSLRLNRRSRVFRRTGQHLTSARSGRYGSYRPSMDRCCAESRGTTHDLRQRCRSCTTHSARNAGSEYRAERTYERRGIQPSSKRRAKCNAGYVGSSASKCTDQVLGARSVVARSLHSASSGAAQICRGCGHCGPAGLQRRTGVFPGGSRPSYAHRLEIASRPECFRPARWRLEDRYRPRSWCVGIW